MAKYTLGIDIGTGGVRVGIFTITGEAVIFKSISVKSTYPGQGMTEQNPEEWWEAIVIATREAVFESGISTSDIVGIGMDATVCTVLFLDENMQLLRPAVMWCDVRAGSQADRIAKTKDPALKYNNFKDVSAEWAPSKMLWIKENEPETWNKTHYVCEGLDYICYLLTGELVSSINPVTMCWYYDNRNGGWPVSFYENAGLGDAVGKFPQKTMTIGQAIGKGLRQEAAFELNLPAGLPVATGCCDGYAATIGLGITKPGNIALSTGTSSLTYAMSENEVSIPGLYGPFPDITIPGYFGTEGGQTTSGGVIKWFVEGGFCEGYRRLSEETGRSVYELLNEEAVKIAPGSDGLVMLEYLQGNRSPWVDANVRGFIYGLNLQHTPAHIYRAVLEAVAYGTMAIIKRYMKHMEIKQICMSGGLIKNDLFLHILADTCGLPLLIPKEMQASCFGSAILGTVAGGIYNDIATAAASMVQYEKTIQPDMDNHKKYQFYLNKYEEVYPVLKDWMHAVTSHR